MVNKCQITFKKGPNKGKKCSEVHTRCRHSDFSCACGFVTKYNSNLKRHKQYDCKLPGKELTKVDESSDVSENVPDGVDLSSEKKRTEVIRNLVTEVKSLKKELNKPTVVNNIKNISNNINNFNISIIGPNFFTELEKKKGRDDAIELLVSSAARNKPMDVLKELYFTGDPNTFPIASRNGRYRYLNEEGQLVEDNGKFIKEIVSTRIQKAMSYAAGTLIKDMAKAKTVDKLFDFYDLGRIQSNIYEFPVMRVNMELSTFTENPTHPFFMDGVVVICLEG